MQLRFLSYTCLLHMLVISHMSWSNWGGLGSYDAVVKDFQIVEASTQGPKTYAKMAKNWQQVKQLPAYSFANLKTFRDKLRAALRLTDDGATSWIDNLSGPGWDNRSYGVGYA